MYSHFSFTLVNAQNWWKDGIKGEGPTVSKTFDLKSFEAFNLQISGNVYIKQGSKQSVKIEGQQNIIDNIKQVVEDKYWKIGFDKPVRKHDPIKVYITVPHLTKAYVSGSGDILGQGKFTNLDDLILGISGSGNIEFDATAKDLEVKISGSGDIDLGW